MKIKLALAHVALAALVYPWSGPAETLKVKNASEAMDACLSYLRAQNPQIAPEAGIQWQEKLVYSDGPVDLVTTSKQFSSDPWIIEVYQGLAPLKNTEFQVIIFNYQVGLYWKGSVKADGSIREESALRPISDDEKKRIAEELSGKSRNLAPVGGYGH